MIILKIGKVEDITRERDVYLKLAGIQGIPLIYGSCVTSPTKSYMTIQCFSEDLFCYITLHGLRQACEVAGTVVNENPSLDIQGWLMGVYRLLFCSYPYFLPCMQKVSFIVTLNRKISFIRVIGRPLGNLR